MRFSAQRFLDGCVPTFRSGGDGSSLVHRFLEHIAVHRYYMGQEQQREISSDEAVQSRYDRVYLPVAAAVWASDILDVFPDARRLTYMFCRRRGTG